MLAIARHRVPLFDLAIAGLLILVLVRIKDIPQPRRVRFQAREPSAQRIGGPARRGFRAQDQREVSVRYAIYYRWPRGVEQVGLVCQRCV